VNRQELLLKINTNLARFTQEVKQFNGSNQYDINIHAENVLIPLIREVFGFDGLQNANVKTKNAPAIDLIDYENGVLIQVTATSDVDKVTKTLTKFTENEQYRPFQRIIIYIITERQGTYRKDFGVLLPKGYDFDPKRDIIDNVGLYNFINNHILGTQKLAKISRLLSDEFSEVMIEKRQLNIKHEERFNTKKDLVFPNLLKLAIPSKIYLADLQFDFDYYRNDRVAEIKEKNQHWKLRRLNKKDDLKHFFRQTKLDYITDYVLYENKVLTFKDLHNPLELLRNVIDLGTITPMSVEEFINNNIDKENVIKSLLKATLDQDLLQRGIEWVHNEKLFRFRMTSGAPKPLKVHWKSKAGKGVIFGVISKSSESITSDEEGKERVQKAKHYVCFRHLAFNAEFKNFGDVWYMAIKPEWSFTSPKNGHTKSQFSDQYMTGIKKLERNGAVFQNFKFLSGYLSSISKGDFVTPAFMIQILEFPYSFETQPSIPDDVWKKSEPKGKDDDKDQLLLDFDE